MTMKITHLYSETAGNRPQAENVDVGQLWINTGDAIMGTKKQDGTLVTFAQLSEAEKQAALNAIPKTGQVAGVTVSAVAGNTGTNAATIDDNSDTVLAGTLTANPFVVTANKTTAHKSTKLVLTKPQGITSSVTWNGVDLWLIGDEAPQFGDTEDEQELCVAIFTSPTKVAVNVVYNTEHPVEVEGGGAGAWGEIEGTLSNQTDLQAALDAKANTSDLSNYVPKTGGAITGNLTIGTGPTTQVVISDQGGMTYGGDEVATVNQIPDVSNFATQSQLQQYVPITGGTLQGTLNVNNPTEDTNAANKGYVDDSIEALNVSQYATTTALTSGLATKADADDLDAYLPVAGGTVTGPLSVQAPTASAHASTKQYVDTAISNLNISQYATTEALTDGLAEKADTTDLNALMPKSGGAFTGAITVQTPTAANHPATKAYVDNATSRVYRSRGSVANEEALPSSGNQNGDVYNVENTGMNYVWDGTKWDALGSFVDLSGYVTKTTADSTYLGKTAKAASATTADKATVLANSRTITLTGDATGSATFNGSANASIAVTVTHADAADTATSATSATSATTATRLAANKTFSLTGAVTGSASSNLSGNVSIATTYTAMKGASSSTAGTMGAVPAPAAGAQSKYLRGDGTWQTPPNTTYSNMTAATADAAGKAGLVPAPAAGYQGRFLRGDGTWQTPTDNKMQQNASTANGEYPLLAKSTTATANINGQAIFDADTTINPSTGTITAKTFKGALSGNATTATTLATARTFRTNLASTSTASFNGGGNCTPGVTGILPITNGGTGNDDGTVAKLTTARTFICNLESTTAGSFNGSANVTLGVSGELPIARGGTGATTAAAARTALGALATTGGTVSGNLTVSGALSGGTLSATSDRRLKDVVGQVGNVDLSTLSAYRYTFKKDEEKNVHIGLIAQDVQKVVPEAVKVIDDEGHLGIEYNALVAILLDKINRLEERVTQLEDACAVGF